MKKPISFISLCLAVVIVLPACAFAEHGADLPFRDVKAGEWYYENVKYVYENGIMKGTLDTEFSPEGTLTRAMCVTILHRVAGEPEPEAESSFTDVSDTAYYAIAVSWAREMGIVQGKTRKVFAPDDKITRAEFATMMYRYLFGAYLDLKETKDSDPSDYSAIPSYAKEAVSVMYRSGVLNGKESGRFDPDAPITRAEAAAIIERFNNTAVPFVREDDGVLDVAFIGDSFTYVPRMFDHLEALAEGKHTIKTYNETLGATSLKGHYEIWKNRIKYLPVNHWKQIRKWDVVILNDYMSPHLGLKEEYLNDYEEGKLYNPDFKYESFEDYYEEVVSSYDLDTHKYYKLFVDLFGKDKQYYNLCESSLMKKESGSYLRVGETSDNGFWWHVFKGNDLETIDQTWAPSNYANIVWRDWLKDNLNINRIILNLETFDPDNPLDPRDFDYMPEDYHPNLMYGYCFSLALYCTMFDEPCIEQNDGIMSTHDYEIPGDTPEEKEAYMVMIKNLVQEELDFQKVY